MEYRNLGRTDLTVSVFSLGSSMFGSWGGNGWGNPDIDDCARMIHRALDAGINLIDTADIYSSGQAEEFVGSAVKGRRDKVLIATKVGYPMGDGPDQRGSSRSWIMRAVEDSLRRLDTDYIDLYQIHQPDLSVDLDETLGALSDLVRHGKVRYLGSSNFPAWYTVEAQAISQRLNLERFICDQSPYSIFFREIERDLLPVLQRYEMGSLVWAPLAQGWLAGKYRRGKTVPTESRAAQFRPQVNPKIKSRFDQTLPQNQRKLDLTESLVKIAAEAGLPLAHMSIAFVLAHPGVTSAILGPRTMDQLEDLLAGASARLTPKVLEAIDKLVPPGTIISDADRGWDPPWLNRSVWGS